MKLKALFISGLLCFSVPAVAESEADQAISYRQGVFRAIEWNLTPLAAMVQGRKPFDADEFVRRSERMVLLGRIVTEGFNEASSARGERLETRASYRIWEARPGFDEHMEVMQARSRALHQAAVEGRSREELRPLLGRLAQSCKSCHDRFRD